MCRQEIPDDYIFNPVLVNPLKEGEGKALEGLMEGGTGAEGGGGVEGGEVEEFMWFYKVAIQYITFIVIQKNNTSAK